MKHKDSGIRARTRRIAKDATDAVRPILKKPRTGAKRTLMDYIAKLPKYLVLLGGLFTDRRVSILDKVLVGAAIAYIVAPIDLVPEFIPFLGQVDDVYLLVLALQRLMRNAGRRVVLDHWTGDASDLAAGNLHRALSAAAFFLPGRIRGHLSRIARR